MPETRLTVEEASDAYANAMRNPGQRGPAVCPICWTFHDPSFPTCDACSEQPDMVDALVPITYSVDSGQLHAALRGYEDEARPDVRRFHAVRLTAILWRFLEHHEPCIAAAAHVERFDIVTTVPSKSVQRDEERPQLRTIVGSWCKPTTDRWRRVLRPSDPPILDRAFAENRYTTGEGIAGARILLVAPGPPAERCKARQPHCA